MSRRPRGCLMLAALIACSPPASSDQPLHGVDRGGPTAPLVATTPCVVSRIIDGDTIECRPGVRIRLTGIDTPEMHDHPSGPQAKQALEGRLAVGTVVQLEGDAEPQDRYGRTLAYVWSDGVMVNWWMMRHGWARLLTVPPNVRWVEALTGAQRAARREQRGFWANDRFSCDTTGRGDC